MNFARRVDELALCALEREVRLEGKPGLVSPASRGSHDDMDLSTFLASLTALRGYFGDCARLGSASEDFGALQRRGLAAEQAMFTATDGVNTHKGAVFTLGLLCAAAGWQWTALGRLEVSCLGQVVTERWGDAIHATALAAPVDSHGAQLRRRHGLPGAREQALAGFPVLFGTTLPQLQLALSTGASPEAAGLHALMATMAVLPDTNLAHRGGLAGLRWAQDEAARFLTAGSVLQPGWRPRLARVQEAFVARWLSPGGSADLLAAAWLLHDLHALSPARRAVGTLT